MTAQWKGWPIASCRSSPSSTTRRHGQDRGTTCTSSETSWRRSRGRSPRGGGGAMPKREDVKTAMVIGSGPIVIGQAAEFDYSGSQACRSLREEGVRVVLVNSNPATIQTDPDTADAVYVEPLTVAFVEKTGYPVIVRAAYTLGGSGSGVAHSPEELNRIVGLGLAYSRIKQVLVEESVLGWKEFEYEVMRDGGDNCITICSMENLDPMGIHTGESIVVAPAQTLSDS